MMSFPSRRCGEANHAPKTVSLKMQEQFYARAACHAARQRNKWGSNGTETPMGPRGFTRLHAWDPHQDHCSTLRLFKFNIIKNTSAELVNACRKEWGPCSGSARPRLRRACHPVPLDLPVLTLGRAARKRKLKTRQGGQV